ncbi:transcription termination/antitermination protein NusA [Deltaproteobacteria bacterium Smac51]|nr:transcription termination/antitermination protein NusA [Deltaproteobacteria bacterium Smac51]
MNSNELKRIIEQVSRDRGIDKMVLIGTLEEAIKSAVKRKYGMSENFEVTYSDETGEIDVFQFKEVVDEVTEPDTQISLSEAKKLDPESSVGEELGVKLDTADFGRIAAQSAKQVIIQRMKDAERDLIFDDYKDRVGEIISGIVQRVDKGNIVLNLGRAEALLPSSEQIPRETYYRRGDRLRALVIDAKLVSRGPQIILSRTHPDFLAALFAAEVPEIAEGIVKIVSVAREPGSRAKISVTTEDGDIDPVGACVGMRGSRVQGVVQELKGEKIDIIPYSQDIAHYVASALAPAAVIRVVVDEATRSLEVIVPDEQLSLAIGRKGQNVRLASRLVGWRIDVKSESKYQRGLKDGYQSLIRLPGVSETMADALFEAGYGSAREVAEADSQGMIEALKLDEAKVDQVKEAARLYLDNLAEEDAVEEARELMAKEILAMPSTSESDDEVAAEEPAPVEEAPAEEPQEDASDDGELQ